jgi:hypothetical protein
MDNEFCTACNEELEEGQIGECDGCQDHRSHAIKMVVLCFNSDGPYLHTCEIRVTDAEKADGAHYSLAEDNAGDNGLMGPMQSFAADDQASSQLKGVLDWIGR